MIVSHFPHGPTVYFNLSNVVLRHDIPNYHTSTVSEQYPHLIFDNFSSALGERVRDVLKYLFPVPKEDSKRVMTFANEDDFISFRWVALVLPSLHELMFSLRHHVFVRTGKQVQLAEVGPRMELKRKLLSLQTRIVFYGVLNRHLVAFEIRQGTLEQAEAEKEWVLSHYSRTSKKRNLLTGGGAYSGPRKKGKR